MKSGGLKSAPSSSHEMFLMILVFGVAIFESDRKISFSWPKYFIYSCEPGCLFVKHFMKNGTRKNKSNLKYWVCSEKLSELNSVSESPNINPAVAVKALFARGKQNWVSGAPIICTKQSCHSFFPWYQNANLPLTVLSQNYIGGSGLHVIVKHFRKTINM